MAITQDLETQELMKKVTIRTMKKDLANLREADLLQERKKISSFPEGTTKKENTSTPLIHPLSEGLLSKEETPVIPKQVIKPEIVQKLASEPEKQHLFSLESERARLEQQAKNSDGKKEETILAQKNTILRQEEKAREALNPIIQEEEKNKKRWQAIEDRGKIATEPSERQRLEKEKSALEEQHQTIEKRRWLVENELAKLDKKIKDLEKTHQASHAWQKNLVSEISHIDNSLKAAHSEIANRQDHKETVPMSAPEVKETIKIHHAQSPVYREKEFTRIMPEEAKQKLEVSTRKEEVLRRKFIEDVERWAKEENK